MINLKSVNRITFPHNCVTTERDNKSKFAKGTVSIGISGRLKFSDKIYYMQTVTETIDKKELLTSTGKSISGMLDLMTPLDNKEANTVPYKDSWTAAMLFRHVSKSLNAMSGAMRMDSKPADRDPGEKIPELKKVFLDFSSKMKSPDFIVPENGPYEKQSISEELKNSFRLLKESAENANLTELVEGLPLGPITKLEILHFVMYHSQRHLHQMKKICKALQET